MDIKNSNIKMTKDNVLLEFENSEEGIEGVTFDKVSKIILPNSWNKNRFVKAKVKSIGDDAQGYGVQVGDYVLVRLLSGIEIGQNHRVCHIDIIEAVLDE